MQSKIAKRRRRARRARGHIRDLGVVRLSVHRTPRHIYAQLVKSDGSQTLASASTVEKTIREECAQTGNRDAATVVGRLIAERAVAAGVQSVAFDRSGFGYHGRIKALADSAREHGLNF